MFSLIHDFIRNAGDRLAVIVMDEEGLERPRRYIVRPTQMGLLLLGVALVVAMVMLTAFLLSPARSLLPGFVNDSMMQEARMNAVRLAAVEDTLAAQNAYLDQIRNLMTGRIGVAAGEDPRPPEIGAASAGDLSGLPAEPVSSNWADHQQPALPLARMPAGSTPAIPVAAADRYLSSLRFPVLPPLQGLLTRGFDARIGHYAVDIAVREGTVVRAIGDGYVILADWTLEAGHVLAVQHADGFVSVYKHNQRLLKRVGDRVAERESIALSGNTGEVTTGPHLHLELWMDGLAQDPRYYLLEM